MRRIAFLAVAAVVLLATGVALAVTNSVSYSVNISLTSTPSAAAPANLAYRWTQHIDTSPTGNQPNTTAAIKIFFAKGITLNAASFPHCDQNQIDGQATFPPACQSAVVGSGTGTAYAGSPGSPLANSVREDLTARVVNGSAFGDKVLLVISSVPGAPVAISNRVIPGTVVAASDPYGFAVRFDTPADLQNQLGLSITLADSQVTIDSAPVGNLSYLEITSCPGVLPIKVVTDFASSTYPSTSYPIATVTSEGTTPCPTSPIPSDGGTPPPPPPGSQRAASSSRPPTAPTGSGTAARSRCTSRSTRWPP